MSITLQLDYYHGEEANQYNFYRIPKALFTDEHFKSMSAEAKILYGLMLDRMGLSTRNGWLDADGRVYIYFTLEDAIDMMGFGHNKIVRLFRELDEIGLIERKKQGQGKPTRVYVKNFVLPQELAPAPDDDSETSENGKSDEETDPAYVDTDTIEEAETSPERKSAIPESGGLDFPKAERNKNNRNNTDFSDTEYPIHPPASSRRRERRKSKEDRMRWMDYYREQIKENIDYDLLQHDYPHRMERIDGYVELMAETCCTGKETVRVNGENMPAAMVWDRLLKLDREHICYVMDAMDANTTRIGNIRAYTLSALYNAPTTMEQYYASMVSHDLAEG